MSRTEPFIKKIIQEPAVNMFLEQNVHQENNTGTAVNMCQKQSLPIIMVLYCYNYMRLILDVIMRIPVNSGHYNNSNNALTLPGVGLDWCLYIQPRLYRYKDDTKNRQHKGQMKKYIHLSTKHYTEYDR